MSHTQHELIWCDANIAKTWPEGIPVLERRQVAGDTFYEADNYFRPDWVADKERRPGNYSWAKLEQPSAAPQLLEALSELAWHVQHDMGTTADNPYLIAANAAIAKATA